jgi:Zn-dependent metalloprotease
MCGDGFHRDPLRCIIPPFLLRRIAVNGSRAQRERAAYAIGRDNTFRALRARPPMLGVAMRRPRVLAVAGQKQRTIYDCQNGEDLLAAVVARAEDDAPTGDLAVDEAYDGLGVTYDLFWEVYRRNSIDDDGMPLNGYVHWGQDYDNAFWNGQQMVFGDGDGDLFNRFTASLDVIAHELTHGVTEDEAQLVYFRESGAINESLSDVFGVLAKQRWLNQTADEADWLIGAELLTDKVNGVALRSMAEPGTAFDDPVLGKDPQPAHMDDFVVTFEDNGGVHINSGIPNKAFHLLATALGGYAWERAGRIWYETLRDPALQPGVAFRRFNQLTASNAARLYGAGSQEVEAVRDAWAGVGLPLS